MKKRIFFAVLVMSMAPVLMAQSIDASYSISDFSGTDSDNGIAEVGAEFDFRGRSYLIDLSFSRYEFGEAGVDDISFGNIGFGSRFGFQGFDVPVMLFVPVVSRDNAAVQVGSAALQSSMPERFQPDAWSLVSRPEFDFSVGKTVVKFHPGISVSYFSEPLGSRDNLEFSFPVAAEARQSLIAGFDGVLSASGRWWPSADPGFFATGAFAVEYDVGKFLFGLEFLLPVEESMDDILDRSFGAYVTLR